MAIDSKQAKTMLAATLIILAFVSAFIILNFKEVSAAEATTDIPVPCAIDAWNYSGWNDCTYLDNGQDGADTYCSCFGYKNASSCYYNTNAQSRCKWTPKSSGNCYSVDEFTGGGTGVTKIKCNCYSSEISCSDAVDNVCDGKIDKEDTDCEGVTLHKIDLSLPFAVDAGAQSGWTYCYFLDDYKAGADTYCSCKGYDKAVLCYYEGMGGVSRYKWTPKETGKCYTQDDNTGGGTGVTKIRCLCHSTEINCTDTIDNDCDDYTDLNDTDCGEVNCTDADNDTYATEGGACGEVDCNDNNAAINPGATENCTNSIDDDCNDLTDLDDLVCQVEVNCTDADEDTYATEGGACGEVDCNDSDSAINPGAVENCTDSIDNDCNNLTDSDDLFCQEGEEDKDGDNYSVEQGDCDDEDFNIHPGAQEYCDDNIDSDCDGDPHNGCEVEDSNLENTVGGGSGGGGSRSAKSCKVTIIEEAITPDAEKPQDSLEDVGAAPAEEEKEFGYLLYAALAMMVIVASAGGLWWYFYMRPKMPTATEERWSFLY